MAVLKWFTVFFGLLTVSPFARGGAFEPKARWEHSEVRVCWIGNDLYQNHPEWIGEDLRVEAQAIDDPHWVGLISKRVQAEFSSEQTGISFIGFDPCQMDPRSGRVLGADAVLVLERAPEFTGLIEAQSDYGRAIIDIFEEGVIVRRSSDSVSLPAVAIQVPPKSAYRGRIPFEDALLITALHEFGHLSGLYHEHSAFPEEARLDPRCRSLTRGVPNENGMDEETLKMLSPELRAVFVEFKGAHRTRYDSDSIMNYCRTFSWLEQGLSAHSSFGLSDGDREILRQIYRL